MQIEHIELPEEKIETCPVCGEELEWVDCWSGCDEGFFDGYEDDPLWYDPGDLIVCSECNGQGGYLECPNVKNHRTKQKEQRK